jgi:hypothetical protein
MKKLVIKNKSIVDRVMGALAVAVERWCAQDGPGRCLDEFKREELTRLFEKNGKT